MSRPPFVIVQLSDLHCGSPYFDGVLLETAVHETIGVHPDLVLVGGDLTAEGYAGVVGLEGWPSGDSEAAVEAFRSAFTV